LGPCLKFLLTSAYGFGSKLGLRDERHVTTSWWDQEKSYAPVRRSADLHHLGGGNRRDEGFGLDREHVVLRGRRRPHDPKTPQRLIHRRREIDVVNERGYTADRKSGHGPNPVGWRRHEAEPLGIHAAISRT